MAIRYSVNRYLASCDLAHGPIASVPNSLIGFYASFKSAAEDPKLAALITIEGCTPEAFRAEVKQIVGDDPRADQVVAAILYTMVCAKLLTLQDGPKAAQQLILIAENTIRPPEDSLAGQLMSVLNRPLSNSAQ